MNCMIQKKNRKSYMKIDQAETIYTLLFKGLSDVLI